MKMKTLLKTIFLIFMSNMVYSQDITGLWSGALSVQGSQLRIVFHVSKSNDQYEVTMDSPDQRVDGIHVSATHFSYPNVQFEISVMGAVFEGTLSDKIITGKWVQSGTSLFLALSKSEEPAKESK